ncbi:MAG: thioredoxin domain-containing protein [Alphaproteobacteria bacterium]|nr:thioredoxin domain-containing protein [Alphaproteobacteria bacterium SS10]
MLAVMGLGWSLLPKTNLASAQDSDGAEALPALTEEQVEGIVRDYLLENPEIIERAMANLQAKREREAALRAQQAIVEQRELLFNNALDPVVGNPEGDVEMVHFFDYQCGFCKGMAQDLANTLEESGRVRAKFKEFPILGPESVIASRVAMAADRQGKYWEVHQALMNNRGRLSEPLIMALAQNAGVDMEKLRVDMNDPIILIHLQENRRMAERLGITGTPGFVIGQQIYRGSMSPTRLNEAIDLAAPSDQTDDQRG